MTKQELIYKAIQKKFTLEFSKDQFDNELIGIKKEKYNYHWFRVYANGDVCFHHSYSQLSDKTKKGVIYSNELVISSGFYN